MAQNVSTPRIYLNLSEYVASVGTTDISEPYYTLPVGSFHVPFFYSIPSIADITLSNPYMALLGHNYTSLNTSDNETVVFNDIINGSISDLRSGFSIIGMSGLPGLLTPQAVNGTDPKVGSILFGTFYDFPRSPDLNTQLSYDYSGIKETTTIGGNTLSNAYYTKPPRWGSLGAWELGGNPAYSKSGRRIWSISYSYLSESEVHPTLAALTNEDEDETSYNTLLDEDTLQRTIHLTNGGQLPFLFCSDGDKPTQDNLAICKFDQNSFQFSQQSPSLHRISLKIREVW